MNHIKTEQTFPNPRTLLQETRDMSSMAIEHFREQIEPKLQQTRFASLTILRNNLATISTNTTNHCLSHHKRSTNRILRRQIGILNKRILKQNLLIKSKKSQMKYYKQLLYMRTKSLINHHKRLKCLEKKSKITEQVLLEIRKDNDTLLQRFDQFILSRDSTTNAINHSKYDEICSHLNKNSKRRKID